MCSIVLATSVCGCYSSSRCENIAQARSLSVNFSLRKNEGTRVLYHHIFHEKNLGRPHYIRLSQLTYLPASSSAVGSGEMEEQGRLALLLFPLQRNRCHLVLPQRHPTTQMLPIGPHQENRASLTSLHFFHSTYPW